MPRYIDADVAKTDAEERGGTLWLTDGDVKEVKRFLDDQPTADVAPVVHAHWIDKEEKIYGYIPNILRICSNCDTEYESTFMAVCCAFIPSDAFGAGDDTKFPKCPCCGAKMEEAKDDDRV